MLISFKFESLVLPWDPSFIPPEEAQALFESLLKQAEWEQQRTTLYGREVCLPRLTAWHGDANASYTYSGIHHKPAPWTPAMLTIKRRVEAVLDTDFNGVLLNQYRSGMDSVSWHSDDESCMSGLIASVSLGATRKFQIRRKPGKGSPIHHVDLTSGSLLIMLLGMQDDWLHCIPKTTKPVAPRINLTFRQVR